MFSLQTDLKKWKLSPLWMNETCSAERGNDNGDSR